MPWRNQKLPFSVKLGELRLVTLRLNGSVFTVHDIEETKGMCSVPPVDGLAQSGDGVAYVESCLAPQPLAKLSLVGGYVRYVPRQYDHYFVDVSGSFQDYLSSFKRKPRKELRRMLKKLTEVSQGQLELRAYSEPDDVEEFYARGRELSAKTYQERLLDAGLPEGQRFRERLQALARAGRMLAFVLFVKDRPTAYLYGVLRDGGVYYLEHMGYDPEYRSWGPGSVMQYLVMERLFAEGRVRVVDYTEGEGHHKKLFANKSVRCADVYFCKPSVRNLVVLFSDLAAQVASGLAATLLAALGLKDSLKRFIRSRV